jgi:L-threonylcarbamoyladenylate synthase
MTKTLKIDPSTPEADRILKAVRVLKSGGTVIFPTETVYGLACSPFSKKAVKKIFRLKGRSEHKPLSVLISDLKELRPLVKRLSRKAAALAKRSWPGPLTLIFYKSNKIPNLVTAGNKTIGIRMPDHKVALALLKKCGMPLVATSANRSGHRPATTAAAAARQIKGADLILNGGKALIGRASTIVDVTGARPKILRLGSLKVKI